MKACKWKNIDGVSVMFGELAGYTVCLAKNDLDMVGISFCNPSDRVKWDRQKGIDLALDRAESMQDSMTFGNSLELEDYVTCAAYKTDYVPQKISDSVRENSKNLSQIANKKKVKAMVQLERVRKESKF